MHAKCFYFMIKNVDLLEMFLCLATIILLWWRCACCYDSANQEGIVNHKYSYYYDSALAFAGAGWHHP